MAWVRRVEALPGEARWAVTFASDDGSEQTAVVQLDGSHPPVAAASLPPGWTPEGTAFAALTEALHSLARARAGTRAAAALRDVDGGWDVALGNIVAGDDGPTCPAHGPLQSVGEADGGLLYECAECGARALAG